MAKQTVASKGINTFYVTGGILLEAVDADGNLRRGMQVTNDAESAHLDFDATEDGEHNAGLLVDFMPQYEVALDSANDTADRALKYIMMGSGGLGYAHHDAEAADAIEQGMILTCDGTGLFTLDSDYAIDYVGRSCEFLAAVTSTNYLYLICTG